MIIERGMQPNCSELVIRLEGITLEKVKEDLRGIGIKDFLLTNFYNWEMPVETDWDTDESGKAIIAVDSLPEGQQKIIDIYSNGEEEEQIKAEIALMEEFGINMRKSTIVLLDSAGPLGMPNGTVNIYEGFDGNEDGVTIMGHQHCQTDMFPLLKKIADHYDAEVEAHDGGGITEYEEWLNGGSSDE